MRTLHFRLLCRGCACLQGWFLCAWESSRWRKSPQPPYHDICHLLATMLQKRGAAFGGEMWEAFMCRLQGAFPRNPTQQLGFAMAPSDRRWKFESHLAWGVFMELHSTRPAVGGVPNDENSFGPPLAASRARAICCKDKLRPSSASRWRRFASKQHLDCPWTKFE